MTSYRAAMNENRCNKCHSAIPVFTEHVRVTFQMTTGKPQTRRYCTICCQDTSMAVLFADVCNNPVKHIEVFVVYR